MSVVIPAYNEEANIPSTIAAIPLDRLRAHGLDVEVLVVDNASTDRTGQVARASGARVIVQPVRGYGNAYKAGFANCTGEVIATGDADLTYPWDVLPDALERLRDGFDFITTNRLDRRHRDAMTRSHVVGNHLLSLLTRALFRVPFRDSQSGMWIFRRQVLQQLRLRSGGMAFSQELKIEAHRRGFRCHEMPISYYPRGGQTKNRTVIDGLGNLGQLVAARLRPRTAVASLLVHAADPAPTEDRPDEPVDARPGEPARAAAQTASPS